MPLHRIEQQLKHQGIKVPRSTMSEWILQVSEKLKPAIIEMQKIVLSGKRIWTGDTIIPLQNDDPYRKKVIQARLWVYIGGKIKDPPLVFYDYSRSRSAKSPIDRLKEYGGYMHADGYPAYRELYEKYQVTYVGCWAHVRRKFYEASMLTKHKGRAVYAIQQIRRLYKIEKHCKEMKNQERKAYRLIDSKPILDELKIWAEAQINAVLPKSQLAKALNYMLNQWCGLTTYLDEGYLMMDNNKAEQHMRPIALGRKNYLFVGSDRGGHAAATIYSLIESCKNFKINPSEYLTDVLTKLPYCRTENEYRNLVPGYWNSD